VESKLRIRIESDSKPVALQAALDARLNVYDELIDGRVERPEPTSALELGLQLLTH
jgi:hypothetical protein